MIRFLVITLFCLVSNILFSQKSLEIYQHTDEYTGDELTITSWVKFNDPIWKEGHMCYLQLAYSQNYYGIRIKSTTGNGSSGIVSVNKGNKIHFKIDNGDVITCEVPDYQIASKGAGAIKFRGSEAYGLEILVMITKEELEQFAESPVNKFRIDLNGGALEVEPEKEKWKDDFHRACKKFLYHVNAITK